MKEVQEKVIVKIIDAEGFLDVICKKGNISLFAVTKEHLIEFMQWYGDFVAKTIQDAYENQLKDNK